MHRDIQLASACPACALPGDRRSALTIAPTYMAVADALPQMAVPDEPVAECWTCRRLRAAGQDPIALVRADERADGLRCWDACRTIEDIAHQHGALTERRGWTVVTQSDLPAGVAMELALVLSLHGFTIMATPTEAGRVRIVIDGTACPRAADARTEREQLASQLAESAAAGLTDWQARERTADDELRYCMCQTLPFLRDRMRRRETAV